MMTVVRLLLLLTILTSLRCSTRPEGKKINESIVTFIQYSRHVEDTFHITVQVPGEYYAREHKHYPVVILLDGNFYFPMMSPVVHQYEIAGLLPPAILVGVGYNSFKTMDSLRVRDYLYPKAMPSDELVAVGGGQKFKAYLTRELLPKIDSSFRTEKENRCLMGHSFGGYFVLYNLLSQLEDKSKIFRTFIAASPSLWYNKFYLNALPGQLNRKGNDSKLNIFISVGSMEDSTWSVKPLKNFSYEMSKVELDSTNFQSRIYNHLDHMDLGVISFTKGLQEFLRTENK